MKLFSFKITENKANTKPWRNPLSLQCKRIWKSNMNLGVLVRRTLTQVDIATKSPNSETTRSCLTSQNQKLWKYTWSVRNCMTSLLRVFVKKNSLQLSTNSIVKSNLIYSTNFSHITYSREEKADEPKYYILSVKEPICGILSIDDLLQNK